MIVRMWRGWASEANAGAYQAHLNDTVLPQLEAIAGFRGVSLLRKEAHGEVEMMVMTRWQSMEAIRAFAGDDPELAVIEPQARAVLSRCDDRVSHYEVALDRAEGEDGR